RVAAVVLEEGAVLAVVAVVDRGGDDARRPGPRRVGTGRGAGRRGRGRGGPGLHLLPELGGVARVQAIAHALDVGGVEPGVRAVGIHRLEHDVVGRRRVEGRARGIERARRVLVGPGEVAQLAGAGDDRL